jgi:hypothetical protein
MLKKLSKDIPRSGGRRVVEAEMRTGAVPRASVRVA